MEKAFIPKYPEYLLYHYNHLTVVSRSLPLNYHRLSPSAPSVHTFRLSGFFSSVLKSSPSSTLKSFCSKTLLSAYPTLYQTSAPRSSDSDICHHRIPQRHWPAPFIHRIALFHCGLQLTVTRSPHIPPLQAPAHSRLSLSPDPQTLFIYDIEHLMKY